MPRFFYQSVIPTEQTVIQITGDDYHHIRDVLRLKPGDAVTVCDGAGSDLSGQISRIDERAVVVDIHARTSNQSEPPYRATLYQGLAKGDKMDAIIQKSVELGVTRVVPMISSRCIAVPDERDHAKKLLRWNRIAAEAAKQSGRGVIPSVGPILTFSQVLDEAAVFDIRLIPWELERDRSVRTALETWQSGQTDAAPGADEQSLSPVSLTVPPVRLPVTSVSLPVLPVSLPVPSVAILIGPEGGFAETEIRQAAAAGLQTVSLGRRILRTETAGPAILAMLLYQFNDF